MLYLLAVIIKPTINFPKKKQKNPTPTLSKASHANIPKHSKVTPATAIHAVLLVQQSHKLILLMQQRLEILKLFEISCVLEVTLTPKISMDPLHSCWLQKKINDSS